MNKAIDIREVRRENDDFSGRRAEKTPGDLQTLNKRELSNLWSKHLSRPAPNVSAALLRSALKWELQTSEHGALSPRTRKRLVALARGSAGPSSLRRGTRLVREWRGKVEVVTIGDSGEINWNDKEWRSLSEVARAITGTRWSGPAFFGLNKKAKAS